MAKQKPSDAENIDRLDTNALIELAAERARQLTSMSEDLRNMVAQLRQLKLNQE